MHDSGGFLQHALNFPGVKYFTLLLAKRFIAGTTPEEAISKAGHLNRLGFPVILNLLGEGVQSKAGIKTAERAYMTLLSAFEKEALRGEISLKATEFGLEAGTCPVCHHYCWWEDGPEILFTLEETNKAGVRLWLDAELLETRQDIWRFASFALKRVSFLGVAYQAYGDRGFNSDIFFNTTIRPLIASLEKGKTLGIRLCKGAYTSSEKWILRDQKKIRERYLNLALYMIGLALTNAADKEKGNLFLEFATHDPILIEKLKSISRNLGLPCIRPDTYCTP